MNNSNPSQEYYVIFVFNMAVLFAFVVVVLFESVCSLRRIFFAAQRGDVAAENLQPFTFSSRRSAVFFKILPLRCDNSEGCSITAPWSSCFCPILPCSRCAILSQLLCGNQTLFLRSILFDNVFLTHDCPLHSSIDRPSCLHRFQSNRNNHSVGTWLHLRLQVNMQALLSCLTSG